MKILIISEIAAVRNSLREILKDEGYEATSTEDGAIGFQMAKKENYDVAIASMEAPNLSGLELISSFKRWNIPTRVILLSSYPEKEIKHSCNAMRCLGYLSIPIDLCSLLDLIKLAKEN